MSSQDSTRDADVIAFERTYPGVTAHLVNIHATSYTFECEAPPETMVAVGLITQAMLDAIPPCGSGSFSPRAYKLRNRAPFYTQLRRRASGRLHMRRWFPWTRDDDHLADTLAFCASIGVEPPAQDDIDAAIAKVANEQAQLSAMVREGIHERAKKRWQSDGAVITVDWDAIRQEVAQARRAGLLGGAA